MKQVIEVATINLENEMDLILAHKRSIRLAELCGVSLSVQTYFATAVSEIARIAMGRKKNKPSSLSLRIHYTTPARKFYEAVITISREELDHSQEGLQYARRLVDELAIVSAGKNMQVGLSQRVPHSNLVSEEKIKSFIDYFKKEPPLSPYDEIRKKNMQLIALSDKLKESENDYRKLTETLPILMFTLNPLGKITRTNEWFGSFFKRTSRQLTGVIWQSFLQPNDLELALPLWEKAQLEKNTFNIQARVRSGQNEYVWHMITIVPLKDKSGIVTEWAGFFVDIHAQKLVEETLKNNEALKVMQAELIGKNQELARQNEFVETIFDSSVDLIAVYDTEMRVLAFNRKCEQIYRIRKEEIIGKVLPEVFPDIEKSQSFRDLRRAMRGQVVHNSAFYSVLAEKHLENFLIPLRDHSGKIYGVLMIAHDITEKVESEQQLLLINEKLQRSNHELEQFAYIASHDLQEPLRKIRSFSDLLRTNLGNRALSQTYLSKIETSAARMSALINDVLNYSRLSSADGTDEQEVDLNLVLQNVKTDFELIMEEKHATVNSNQLPVIRGVALQLHQLFYNLISNSLKFSEQSPVVHIFSSQTKDAEIKELGLEPRRKYVTIVFRDNGIGFEQQYANQIFTIFHRLHGRGDYTGTGIGLALCKKIIDGHHGRIVAYGKPGEGAEFRIVLPVGRA